MKVAVFSSRQNFRSNYHKFLLTRIKFWSLKSSQIQSVPLIWLRVCRFLKTNICITKSDSVFKKPHWYELKRHDLDHRYVWTLQLLVLNPQFDVLTTEMRSYAVEYYLMTGSHPRTIGDFQSRLDLDLNCYTNHILWSGWWSSGKLGHLGTTDQQPHARSENSFWEEEDLFRGDVSTGSWNSWKVPWEIVQKKVPRTGPNKVHNAQGDGKRPQEVPLSYQHSPKLVRGSENVQKSGSRAA